STICHKPAAQAGEPVKVSLVDSACGAESGQLAVAVTAGRIGGESERFDHPECPQADPADCRLGSLCGAEFFLIAACCSFGEIGDRIDPVRKERQVRECRPSVGFSEGSSHLRKGAGKVAEHAGVL